jgi:cellulose synthase/poly-beta-1,6-N-acetylglucosamine synthase-like glycosyltransferase
LLTITADILLFLWYAVQAYVLAACLYITGSTATFLVFNRRIRRIFQSQQSPDFQSSTTHFTLLIPAHNEARLLPQLLASIRQLRYPATHFQAVVVADNCTDATAAIARQAGFACIERATQEHSDKMQALQFAAHQVLTNSSVTHTVVCIIDADCVLEHHFLLELDKVYARPGSAPVVQAFRSVGNAFASDVTVLDAAAEALRQWVLAGSRKVLGLDNFIFGLGCTMRREVFLELMLLPVVSLAEDKEWKVFLTERNIRIDYCPTARLSYEVVAEAAAFGRQRDRWLAGYYQLLRAHGLPMLLQGIRQASFAKLDMACDLLQPPRSVLVLAVAGFSLLAFFFPQLGLVSYGVWLAIVLLFLAYAAIGLRLIRAPARAYLMLFFSTRLLTTVAKSMLAVVLGRGVNNWNATRGISPDAAPKAQ